jgi:hypothetical protein
VIPSGKPAESYEPFESDDPCDDPSSGRPPHILNSREAALEAIMQVTLTLFFIHSCVNFYGDFVSSFFPAGLFRPTRIVLNTISITWHSTQPLFVFTCADETNVASPPMCLRPQMDTMSPHVHLTES